MAILVEVEHETKKANEEYYYLHRCRYYQITIHYTRKSVTNLTLREDGKIKAVIDAK